MNSLDLFIENFFNELTASADECGINLPSCRFVSHCAPPVDCCDIMAVYPGSIRSDSRFGVSCSHYESQVDLYIELWFCVSLPSFDEGAGFFVPADTSTGESLEMQKSAYETLDLALSLLGSDKCCGSIIDSFDLSCQVPSGGCASWKIRITTTPGRCDE